MMFKLFGVEPVNIAAICFIAYDVTDSRNNYAGGFGTLAEAKRHIDRLRAKYPDRSFYINGQKRMSEMAIGVSDNK